MNYPNHNIKQVAKNKFKNLTLSVASGDAIHILNFYSPMQSEHKK